jgi:hypothetical protein
MDSNISTAKMVYGAALTLPVQPPLLDETPPAAVDRQRVDAAISTQDLPQRAPTEAPVHLKAAEMLYVRKGGQPGPLAPPYSSPYRVLSKGPKYLNTNIGGKQQAVTVDCLKPHMGAAASTPAAPPRRGRPPAAAVCRRHQRPPARPGGHLPRACQQQQAPGQHVNDNRQQD